MQPRLQPAAMMLDAPACAENIVDDLLPGFELVRVAVSQS
jgi:hypothetical protein